MASDEPTSAGSDERQAAAPTTGAAGSVFAITVPATSVTLDANREATVPFTVSNTSGRALRGGALLVTPDFQVAQAPPPPPPRPFPWWIVAVIVALVVVVGVILFLVLRNTTSTTPPAPTPTATAASVAAPAVIGLLAPNAEATIQTAGLQVGTITTRAIAAGTPQVVVAQTPAPAAVVPRNSSMDLVVTGQPRVIVNQPAAAIAVGSALDLETGAAGPASAPTNIGFATTPGKVGDTAVLEWTLQTPSGSRFALLPAGTPANHDTCVSALNNAQPNAPPFQSAMIAAGTAFCVQQSNGHVSLLQVTATRPQVVEGIAPVGDTSLHVALTTWDQ
jgi:hypothetical protein